MAVVPGAERIRGSRSKKPRESFLDPDSRPRQSERHQLEWDASSEVKKFRLGGARKKSLGPIRRKKANLPATDNSRPTGESRVTIRDPEDPYRRDA